jgi:hypothetical protein
VTYFTNKEAREIHILCSQDVGMSQDGIFNGFLNFPHSTDLGHGPNDLKVEEHGADIRRD